MLDMTTTFARPVAQLSRAKRQPRKRPGYSTGILGRTRLRRPAAVQLRDKTSGGQIAALKALKLQFLLPEARIFHSPSCHSNGRSYQPCDSCTANLISFQSLKSATPLRSLGVSWMRFGYGRSDGTMVQCHRRITLSASHAAGLCSVEEPGRC